MATNSRADDEAGAFGKMLDQQRVIAAYARWAPIYDAVFGFVMEGARKRAARAVPADCGRVLEIGVGTGISLSYYPQRTRIVGIDISPDMLRKAEERVARQELANVEAVLEMDACALEFPDNSFDAAMAMYVVTVVPDPVRMLAEARRVVRPGGRLIVVSHFAPTVGWRAKFGNAMGPVWRYLGWNDGISMETIVREAGLPLVKSSSAAFNGYYRLLEFEVVK
jgi:phosphatidylethanolamine/phosphatidyl-N-methylethanolamine N-methyltransferase